jgi:hypothetical protein
LLVISSGCVRQLPPAPTPAATLPPLPTGAPPANGQSRLVVDVTDGPAPVQRVQLEPKQQTDPSGHVSYQLVESPHELCPRAPCVTDLPPGNVLLGFPVIGKPDDLEIELVHAGPDPSVYRRTLSVYTDDTGGLRVMGIIMTSVGGASAITGTTLLPIGLAKGNDGLTVAGSVTLGAGAVLLALGIWAIRHDAPTYRPGSSNHFPLSIPR